MIHRLPQHELIEIKNSQAVQDACMAMYQAKYQALKEIHGDKLAQVLQPWIDLMQGKMYTIPTDSWGTAAHTVWVDYHYDSTVLIHCHAGIWYQTNVGDASRAEGREENINQSK